MNDPSSQAAGRRAPRPRAQDLGVLIALTVIAFAVIVQYDPTNSRLASDQSYMVYAGQQILRGIPPYTGVTIVKTPLTALVAAGAIAVGRAAGWNDVLAARIGFMLLAALLIGLMTLLGKALDGRWTGVLAAVILLGFDGLASSSASGPSPKIVFTLFGVMALWFTALGLMAPAPPARGRSLAVGGAWFLAGAAGALAFLAWQPGLLFIGAASLGALLVHPHPMPATASDMARRDSLAPRLRAAAFVVMGAVMPVALIALYLALNGALVSGIRQSFLANASYFNTVKLGAGLSNSISQNLAHLLRITPRCFSGLELVPVLGIGGGVGAVAAALARAARNDLDPLRRLIPPLAAVGVLGAFTLIDLQGCADLLPFYPFLALGGGWLLWQAIGATQNFLERRGALGRRLAPALPFAIAVLFLLYGIVDVFSLTPDSGLAEQQRVAASISRHLAPGDKLQQFGDAIILVLLQRENATRFVSLGPKQGAGVLYAEGIAPEDLPQILTLAHPKVITLSHAKGQPWAKPLLSFLETQYELGESYDSESAGTRQMTDVYILKAQAP